MHEVRDLRLDVWVLVSQNSRRNNGSREGASAPSSLLTATPPPSWLATAVLYQDDEVLVLNKPSGLAVHPGPKTPESLENYLPLLSLGRRSPPQPVHRLDRDTSGCLVLGRTRGAVKRLSALFATSQVEKTYWAVVTGAPAEAEGVVTTSIRKHNDHSGWRMVADDKGLRAETHYRVLASGKGAALLELHPKTGRTHQIRIHCALLGCPVMDDPIYGSGAGALPHRLHARRIVLPAGKAGLPIDVNAPLPPETVEILQTLGLWQEGFL